MGSKWPRMSLREARVELIDCDHRTPPPATAGYPYVTIPDLRDGRIDVSDARRITPDHYREWTRRAKPQPNDVVLSRRTNPGVTAFVPSDLEFALGQNLVLLRSDGSVVDPQFLRWLVRTPDWWEQIQRHQNVGAVFDSLKCADIPNFRLPIPALKEQRRIAEFLTALDDKIELNRRMSQTLESMARALFKSWFVDFDPVVAKADGVSSGLPSLVEGLFPDSLDDSEYGAIPAGWRVATLGEFADLNPESWSRGTQPESIRYVDLASAKSGRIEATSNYSWSDAPSRAQRVLRPGDTIFGTVRPGNRSYALVADEGLTGSTGFAVLRPKQREYREWVYLCATADDSIEELTRLADGAAYPAVRADVVAAMRCLLPRDPVLQAFSRLVGPLLDRIAAASREASALQTVRDELLPELLAGEGQSTCIG